MNLVDIVNRTAVAGPWADGEKIPWNEPGFSQRMLREHLSQDHDAASRRFGLIDQHVAWIHGQVLGGRAGHILDLGCGPGLYTRRFAGLGHVCTGIDFSPASVAYAREQDAASTYVLEDVRAAAFGTGYDLAMMIFGEFNTFRREDARLILTKAHAALKPGGILLLEPHTVQEVRDVGQQGTSWYTAVSGLFSDRPHLLLKETFWDETGATSTERYYLVDAETGAVTRHAISMQSYSDDAYRALLEECGFTGVTLYPSLDGVTLSESLIAITARKPA